MKEDQLPTRLTHEEVTEVPRSPLVLDKIFVGVLKPVAIPSVKNVTRFVGSGTVVSVTFFTEGQDGQEIQILGDGTTTIVHDMARIVTAAGANTLLAVNKLYKFTKFNGIWYEHQIGAGGGGSSFTPEIYTSGYLITDALVTPRPIVDTDFPGLVLNITASSVLRRFLVFGHVTTNLAASAGDNVRSSIYLDSTNKYKGSNGGIGFAFIGTDETSIRILQWVGVLIDVPGDSAAHTISAKYNAVGTTSAITFRHRYLTAVKVV